MHCILLKLMELVRTMEPIHPQTPPHQLPPEIEDLTFPVALLLAGTVAQPRRKKPFLPLSAYQNIFETSNIIEFIQPFSTVLFHGNPRLSELPTS